jgi:hypothetical protein
MALAGESGIDEGVPDESWLNRDIAAYAAEHGIALGSASTKNAMLDVIQEAIAA